MDSKREHTLFSPSGCLTEDCLLLNKLGMLSEDDYIHIKNHLEFCELCAAAVDGYEIADQALFSEDVEMLNLESTNMAGKEDFQEPAIPETSGFEGPRFPRLSQEEIRDFTNRIKATTPGPAIVKPEPARASFLRRYRTELIAAILLLLIGFGSRQVYLQLRNTGNTGISAVSIPDTLTATEERTDHGSPGLPAVPGKDGISPPPETKASELIVLENDSEDTDLSISPELSIPIEDKEKATAVAEAGAPPVLSESARENETVSDSFISMKVQSDISANKLADQKVPAGTNEAVAFGKTGNNRKRTQVKEEAAEAEIFTVVEESPQFPGGDEERIRFLTENISYPHEAREASIQGTVYITFVVEKDGTIEDVRVLRGIGGGCDEEAVRVIRKMPRWSPGKQRGKPVRVQFNMPIKFSMAG
jgi:TonB family protein